MKRVTSLLFSALLTSTIYVNTAMAAGYVGIGIGSTDIEGVDDSSFKLYGGSKFNGYGLEVAYHDLGKQEESAFGLTASTEATGFEFSGVGYLPVSPTTDFFGKFGLLMWDMDLNLTGFPTVSEDGSDFIFGFGIEFDPVNNLAVRLEFQTTTLDVNGVDFDTDILSVGATFKF